VDQVDDDVAEEVVVSEDDHQYLANMTLQEEYPTGRQRREEEVGIAFAVVVEKSMDCYS
jgi:hypothetical protein